MGRFLRVEATIDAAADARPDAVALVCGPRRWTYAALRAERDRRAGVLVEAGLHVGDRVVTAERVTDDYVISYLACARAGLVHASLSPLLATAERATLAGRLRPRLALTADGARRPGLPAATFPLSLPGTPAGEALAEAARRSAAGTPGDLVSIRHTSGTTGQEPKLVARAHQQFTWTCDILPWGVGGDSISCMALTTVFIAPEVCRVFRRGATLVLPRETQPRGLEEELAAAGATVVYTAPALLGALAQQATPPPPGLRLTVVRTIGAGLPTAIKRAAEARYGAPVLEEYGTSECIAIMRSPEPRTPAGSVGQPYPGVEVRLLDGAGREVPDGAIGELVIRSPGIMVGYLDDPAATALVLRDGWYHTGDNARRDAQGYYYLLGRRGLLINVGGNKVAPEEVEAVLEAHPAVREAVVVPQPDALRGEVVKAIVVPAGEPPDAQELRRFCRARLAGYKVPRVVAFRAEPLPRSALGKVLRQRV